MFRLPCKDYCKGTCTTLFCEKWHLPECLFYTSENGCRFGVAYRQVNEHASKRSHKNCDKSAVATLKISRQLDCVFQDMKPPKFSSILRKRSDIRKPIRCVQHTKAVVRHATIRDQNLSLGMICPGELHQRSPNAQNGNFDLPVKQRGSWPKNILTFSEKKKKKQHSSHHRKIDVYLYHHPSNQRKETLL